MSFAADLAPQSKTGSGAGVLPMLWLLPVAIVCAWWVNDLRHQWASLVEYHFGWIVVMLAGYLVWERWPTRPLKDEPASFGPNLLMAAAGSVCVATGELYRIGIARTPHAHTTKPRLFFAGARDITAAFLFAPPTTTPGPAKPA